MSTAKTAPSKGYNQHSGTNPFDSDSESVTSKPPRASSAPAMTKVDYNSSQPGYSGNGGRGAASSSSYSNAASRNRYKNDFHDSGGMENQSIQELEGYAVYKAEETTQKVNGCLKIAEEIREDASRTLVTLHQQGEQITRTHQTAANIEHDLSRGEKLLGSLGGLFSKTWKPKRGREIKGPVLTRDDSFIKRGSHMEQRQRLGLSSSPTKSRSNTRQFSSEPTSALEKVEVEKAKQDDALEDLSDLLGQLKGMAVDMGCEMERQNKALDHVEDDVDEITFRVKGVNLRARRLLGK
ncbi:SNAP25 homologous protein SNAP33-like [Iris pallida]|uniref:SNAP25 homologous protein SNAP33-like n=1 Tax=Iris pallida TaxID=29817 RepID=A0AAX6IE56_IRIPA|nr:SNAP25 homologous protein SNAP33-like [Iris pallida]KAJ6851348.1 SNAP25 homologous protein SNAP33-like [Iris pallida]